VSFLLSKFGVLNLLGTWASLLGDAGEQRHILERWSISHILPHETLGNGWSELIAFGVS
jgi:hypothetical protein